MKSIMVTTVVALVVLLAIGCGTNKQGNKETAGGQIKEVHGIAAAPQNSNDKKQLCTAHSAPKDVCFICDPNLRDPKRLWCKEHSRYEDRCFLCHPEIQDKARLYCNEHGLYEDECFLCHLEIGAPASGSVTGESAGHSNARGRQGSRLMCNEHGVYEDECGSCHPEIVENLEPGKGMKVKFVSKESAQKAGVSVEAPREFKAVVNRLYPGKITFNKDRFSEVVALFPGIVKRVHVRQGEKVRKGQILAEIHSAEIADAQRTFLTAQTQTRLKKSVYEREWALFEQNVVSEQNQAQAFADYQSSEQELESARQRLNNLGFTNSEIENMRSGHHGPSFVNVRAPFNGTIIEKHAVEGRSVETSAHLFDLVDMSTMWMELAVPAIDAKLFLPGDSVAGRFDEISSGCVGKITWVSSRIDSETRTVTIRAAVDNTSGSLRDAMFGEAGLVNASGSAGIGIPESAVQRMAGKDYAFVKIAADLFEVRRIVAGGKSDGIVGILDGLSPDDQIVVAGSFTVRSELQKSKLGAGCTDH